MEWRVGPNLNMSKGLNPITPKVMKTDFVYVNSQVSFLVPIIKQPDLKLEETFSERETERREKEIKIKRMRERERERE